MLALVIKFEVFIAPPFWPAMLLTNELEAAVATGLSIAPPNMPDVLLANWQDCESTLSAPPIAPPFQPERLSLKIQLDRYTS